MWKYFPRPGNFFRVTRRGISPWKLPKAHHSTGYNGRAYRDKFLVYYLLQKPVLGLNTCFHAYSREKSDPPKLCFGFGQN
jgi:hypothetical protein